MKYRKVLFMLSIIAAVPFSGQGETIKPVIAILESGSRGISGTDCQTLIDLLGANLLETNECHVIGRLEQKKLLDAAEFGKKQGLSRRDYEEAGRRLFADFIIVMSIDSEGEAVVLSVELFDTVFSRIIENHTNEFGSIDALAVFMRPLSRKILQSILQTDHRIDPGERVLETLSPVTVKERILFLLPAFANDETTARVREILHRVLQGIITSRRFMPFIAEISPLNGTPERKEAEEILSASDCHYAAMIVNDNGVFRFVVFGENNGDLYSRTIGSLQEPEIEAAVIIRMIEEKLPFLSQDILAAELKKNIRVEEKLGDLLSAEKILARRWTVSIYQKLVKPAMLYYYTPMMCVLSFESDICWYYGAMFGLGAGYGYSYSYPGAFDPLMTTLPYIHQHEIRLIPFSFRTGGKIGFALNVVTALTIHNSWYIKKHDIGGEYSLTWSDEKTIWFFKAGINAGLTINLGEPYALYWNGLFFNFAFSPIDFYDYGDLEGDIHTRPFSIDVAGLGFIFRF
ncbi:MAG: hypothetical protein JW881_09010 [Spirochaetales bacterium]|nr:hypothetical protein [Spirochaetales bacterium]